MSPTTTPTRPRRTVGELIEAGDPEFLAGCGRIAASIRESLEAAAHLEPGDAALEGVDPAEIRDALQRAYEAPAAARQGVEPAVQGPDAVAWKRHWKRQLTRLRGLPLLAVGAGPDRKAPANLRNGQLLGGWQTTAHTPAQIETAHRRICGAGTRTGKAAGGLVVLDVDGASAVSWLLERGCDPLEAQTWQIHRNTDTERLKIAWRLSDGQQSLLGQIKRQVKTRPGVKDASGKVLEKGEAVELFHGEGQVVVLGEHPTSGGFYWWPEGLGPEALAPVPPVWWEAVLQIAQPPAAPVTSASGRGASSGRGAWRRLQHCPICNRTERQFCSIHRDGRTIRCFHGSTFSPVQAHGQLRAGDEITDAQGQVWAFSRVQESAGEAFSIFVAPDPTRRRSQRRDGGDAAVLVELAEVLPGPEPKQLPRRSSRDRHKLEPDEVLALLPARLGQLRLNVRSGDVHTRDGVLNANEISRLYLQLSNADEKWAKEVTADAVALLASQNPFDPVEQYLNGIKAAPLPIEQWQRLDHHLLGIDDPIAAAFLPRFLISAVARAFEPGCDVRQVPVLIGRQWRGKSALGRILFGSEHWVEGIDDLGKDALMKARSAWGVELAELDGVTRRSDQERLKAFITEQVDTYRAPYDRSPERHPRRFVFWATSNGAPLRDSTGSTRFVCIKLPDRMLPLDWAQHHRDAIWARAVEQYRSGVEWRHGDEAEREAIEARNADHAELDPWAERVAGYLQRAVQAQHLPVKVTDVLAHLEVPMERMTNAAAKRVSAIAQQLGWEPGRRRPAPGKNPVQGLWPVHPVHPSVHPVCTPADRSGGNGSGPLCTPCTPKTEKLETTGGGAHHPAAEPPTTSADDACNAEGFGVFLVHGVHSPEIDCAAVEVPCTAGVHRGVHRGVHSTPPTIRSTAEWVEMALAELRLAPHLMHLPEVVAWIQAQPGAPAIAQAQVAGALDRLAAAERAAEQRDLLPPEVQP